MSTVVKIDPRVCVKQEETGLTVNRQDISIVDTIEVLRRIQFYMRTADMTGDEPKVDGIDDWNWFQKAEGEAPKVCIAWDIETRKIRFNITGLEYWEVCTLLELACSYLNAVQLGLIQEN